MINYTKGEWKVGKATDAMGYETPIYANTDEGRDYEIATVHIYNGEQIANAQLIASVPDLYEALKYIIRELDKADIIKANSIFMLMPVQALAKAEGK